MLQKGMFEWIENLQWNNTQGHNITLLHYKSKRKKLQIAWTLIKQCGFPLGQMGTAVQDYVGGLVTAAILDGD